MKISSSSYGANGARRSLYGTTSNGATWHEDVELTDNDTVITDADTWTWQFNFRERGSDSVSLSLSTTATTLAISQGASSTTIQIRVPAASLSDMEGDYIADLSSKDDDDRIIHWAHGVMTFTDAPPWE